MPALALRAAAWSWAVVTLIGQWLFFGYLVAHYGVTTVSGHPERWNKARLFMGYVPGDTLGNLTFAMHVLFAAVVLLGGMLQLVPQIRERALALHRWNGRVFALAALLISVDGLYMVWVRHATFEPVNTFAVSLDAVLILAFVAAAWRAARARDIDRHRRWALRAFMVTNAVFFIRIFFASWDVFTGGIGTTKGMDGPMNYFFELGSYLLPLAVLELYLRARSSAHPGLQLAAAIVVMLAAIYVAVGTVAYMPHKFQIVT